MAACDKKSPSAPPTPAPDPGGGVPPGIERITGTERIGWDEQAGSSEELATFRHLIYVDGTGSDIQDVTCASTAGPAGFSCTGRLPAMTAGQHSLALSAYINSGGTRLESPRSASFPVLVVAQTTSTASTSSSTLRTADGVELRANVVAEGLEEPTDLTVAPDGRIYIAERPGRIRVFRAGRLMPAPALTLGDATTAEGHGLLALTLDPKFDQNHFLYGIYTTAAGFRLARFRAVGDTLGDRAILMDAVPAAVRRPAATLRFGPDAKLYVGYDNLGQAARSGDLGSFNGKILRLNPDGTTPSDQRSGNPVYGSDLIAPRGLDWDGGGTTLWVADGHLDARDPQGSTVARYNLPNDASATALAFYRGDLIRAFRGNLFVAADGGRVLLRLTFESGDPRKVATTERLSNGLIEGARAIAVGRDGAIYIGTTHALVRLAP